jgi:hypothetical protein
MPEEQAPKSTSIGNLKREFDPDEEIVALRALLREREARLDEYKKEHGNLTVFFNDLKDALTVLDPPKMVYKKPASSKVSSPVSSVLHLTDWHIGSVQDASEVEGFNEYSPEIAQARLDGLGTSVMNWIALNRNTYTINELVLLVTGDLISGDIHDELRITNAYPTPMQAVTAGSMLASTTAMLAPHFERVRVEFVTADNHARLTKKPQAKEAGMNTHNYVVGWTARQLLENLTNVQFNLYPMIEKSVDVQGWRYLLMHGNQIKGWAGFPYYGVERQVGREAQHRMNMEDAVKFHKIVLGHFHAPLNHPKYMIGGSLSGTDAYDHAAGRHATPSQSAWLVHPKHGEFNWTPFRVV